MNIKGRIGWRLHGRLLIVAGVVVAAITMSVASAALAQDVLHRFWADLAARPSGPMAFRFLLQPAMAILFAFRDGIRDARTGRSPYFWTILSNPAERKARLYEGIKATLRIILLGLVMDAIYQHRVLGTFYPTEALIISVVLAFIPYLLLRGPAARLARWWMNRPKSRQPH